MDLAIFDLDNTLIGGDSDYLWGEYLAEIGAVEPVEHQRENERFYEQYRSGTLDIHAFLAFQLKPLAEHPLDELLEWRARFLAERIEPIVLPKAVALVKQHQRDGHMTLVVTATNRFVTEPIAALFGVDELIATEPERDGERFTGRPAGTPCFAAGKVVRLENWIQARALSVGEQWFYSDSHNDLPLLRAVTYPVAVDPDSALRRTAAESGWPIISLR